MAPRKVDESRFDAAGTGDPDGSIFGLPYSADESSVVMIAAPWEPTTSYGTGTAEGPEVIRRASVHLDLVDAEFAELGLARPWVYGLHMGASDPELTRLNSEAGRDRGDVGTVNALSSLAMKRVEGLVLAQLDAGKIVGLVGGDHSLAYGSIAAAAGSGLGVLQVDAHADLRVAYEGFEHSHASVMHNVLRDFPSVSSIVQVGVRDLSEQEFERIATDDRVHVLFDHALRAGSFESHIAWVLERLPPRVWISFDIDGLEPSLCPGTGTPVPGGLGFGQAMSLLARVAESGREVVGFDLVEVAGGEWDGNVGGRVLYRLCAAALFSQGARDWLARKPP